MMKITQNRTNNSNHYLQSNKDNAISLRPKSRKRMKNKFIESISQPVNSKVSNLNPTCGTTQFFEISTVRTVNQTPKISSIQDDTLSKIALKIDNKKSVKPRKRNLNKIKPESRPHSCPANSIVKMTSDTYDIDGNNILQDFSDIKKSNNSKFSLLETLFFTGGEERKTQIKVTNHESLDVPNAPLALKENSQSKHSPIKMIAQSGLSTKNRTTTSTVDNDFSKGPICSIYTNCNETNLVATFYELGFSKYLVLMEPESNLIIIGTVEVNILKGSLEVMGYKSQKEGEKLLIYSLQGSSHLSLKATDVQQKEVNDSIICEKLIVLGLPKILSHKVAKKAGNKVLFSVNRSKTDVSSTVWPYFFEHHSSFSIFPNSYHFHNDVRPCHKVERRIQCLFETNLQELGLKEFIQVPEWIKIEKAVLGRDYPKAILCGGKSVGKSSFLRYLVNKCLSKWKEILVLDFDLGQCEFTIPGCISVTLVKQPLLGPNYSHLKESKRCIFLGEVDVTKCPEKYIEGCKLLIDYAKNTHADVPWVINTMGFTRGFGVSLACGIINYIQPTDVIQIQSKDRKLNFPSLLEPKFISCLKHSAFDKMNSTLDYQLYTIPSGSEQPGFISKSRGMSPAESRSLVILSYLSKMLDSNISCLSQVVPYSIDMECLDLQTTNKCNFSKTQVAATMSGNMVALCHQSQPDNFLNCCGFGIVRAIDWQNGTIFLITPVPPSELSKVNCLVKGNVGLPDSLYYNQGNQVAGHAPYLALTSGGSTARFAKRDFRNTPISSRQKR